MPGRAVKSWSGSNPLGTAGTADAVPWRPQEVRLWLRQLFMAHGMGFGVGLSVDTMCTAAVGTVPCRSASSGRPDAQTCYHYDGKGVTYLHFPGF